MVRRSVLFVMCAMLLAPISARADTPMGGGLDHAKPDESQQTDQAPPEAAQSGKGKTGPDEVVKSITVSTPRDMGFFQGDLVDAKIDVVVADGYSIDTASLPQPGPIAYWLDVRKIEVTSRATGGERHYTLRILYQDFYDALDAREQEIPSFSIDFTKDGQTISAYVPSWTIAVSPLREITPPPQSDPKNYLRPDEAAPFVAADPFWRGAGLALLAAVVALVLLAWDRAWWPFQARPARVFADALRRLRTLGRNPVDEGRYLEGLRAVHRGIDATAGRRVLAEDLPGFLQRHPVFAPARDNLAAFFAASRRAFFGSDPGRARTELDFPDLVGLARRLAAIERART